MLWTEEVFEIAEKSSIEWGNVNTISHLEVFVSSSIESFVGRHREVQNLTFRYLDIFRHDMKTPDMFTWYSWQARRAMFQLRVTAMMAIMETRLGWQPRRDPTQLSCSINIVIYRDLFRNYYQPNVLWALTGPGGDHSEHAPLTPGLRLSRGLQSRRIRRRNKLALAQNLCIRFKLIRAKYGAFIFQ